MSSVKIPVYLLVFILTSVLLLSTKLASGGEGVQTLIPIQETSTATEDDHCMSNPETWSTNLIWVYGTSAGVGLCVVNVPPVWHIVFQGQSATTMYIDYMGFDAFIPRDDMHAHQNVRIWNEDGFLIFDGVIVPPHLANQYLSNPTIGASAEGDLWITVYYQIGYFSDEERYSFNGNGSYTVFLKDLTRIMIWWQKESATLVPVTSGTYSGPESFIVFKPPVVYPYRSYLPMTIR